MENAEGTATVAGGYRWLLSTPSAWPDAEPSALGLTEPESSDIGDLLAGALHDWRGEGFLVYHRYQLLAAMHRERVRPFEQRALRDYDHASHKAARTAFLDCASQIGMVLGISRGRAEGMLQEATDLLTRLPQVAERLRDGVISEDLARKIIERTDLIIDDDDDDDDDDDGADERHESSVLGEVDAAIAAELDRGAGAWSLHLVRDLADRIVFRSAPDAVRARREAAKSERRVWTANTGDDMGLIAATMSGERIRLSMESVRALANAVCPNDPRTTAQRNSDAVFALLNQLSFECSCDDPQSCSATVVNTADAPGSAVVPVKTKTVVHVVADKATVDGRESNPGFMDGHGVISGDYVRDLLDDPTTLVRPLGPDDELAVFLDALNNDDTLSNDDVAGDVGEADDAATGVYEGSTGDVESPRSGEASARAGDGTGTREHEADSDSPSHTTTRPQRMAQPTRSEHSGSSEPEPEPEPVEFEVTEPEPTETVPTEPEPTEPEATEPEVTEQEPVESEATEPEPTEPEPTEPEPTATGGEIVLPATQPHNPYRPSTALDTFIRIRDGYTLIPGNAHSAFHCDLDHWTEYRHHDPTAGGQTEPGNLGAKDRFGHNRKTHGDWVDDLIVDPDGRACPIFITPDAIVIEGRAGPGIDLFPGLARYRFTQPAASDRRKPGQPRPSCDPPRARTADKHAQRLAERERIRAARKEGTCVEPPAVRKLIAATLADIALGDPPF
ncbi:DUF222 domain-containing protein [Gordonia sp. TBRC 11910]|uniref:DUF222 domain-containing protein n=1 Tax=Gordonia asplenii TaxID=2725283 RepID=A0A848KSX4_9ACTN|nr:DUF222 domain-containing protein [Gordonia asplenii]NMN99602.1 DUF222 domain-containing protein [Gordonia asplenii]